MILNLMHLRTLLDNLAILSPPHPKLNTSSRLGEGNYSRIKWDGNRYDGRMSTEWLGKLLLHLKKAYGTAQHTLA